MRSATSLERVEIECVQQTTIAEKMIGVPRSEISIELSKYRCELFQ